MRREERGLIVVEVKRSVLMADVHHADESLRSSISDLWQAVESE